MFAHLKWNTFCTIKTEQLELAYTGANSMKNQEEKEKYQSIIDERLSIRAAARMLKIAPTTAYRRLKKFKKQGNLTHGNTGKANRPSQPDKEQIIELASTKYEDFGISHTCELLESREGLIVNRETLRRWLNRPKTRKQPKQRHHREPMPNFGDLLQIDGSFDYWFGNEKSCLMNIVDDATNIAELHFEKQETVISACRCAYAWFKKYGVPHAFYADGRNMYHLLPEREHNFFTAMCEHLGIRVILARSPQAKGRVERWNGIHQKRLIPLMKLDKVYDMKNANKYLENYIVEHNKKHSHKPALGNSHRPLPEYVKSIDDVCYIIVERTLNNDWTFSYNGKIYQFPQQSKYPPARKKISLKITLNGNIYASYRCSVFIVH